MAAKPTTGMIQPGKNQEKTDPDKKSQAVEKAKKSQPSATQPKKRRFTFFGDILGELRKVVWPTRQETIRLTLIVLGICIFMGIVLGGIDFGFSELMARVFLGGK